MLIVLHARLLRWTLFGALFAIVTIAGAQTNTFLGANLNGIGDFRRNHEFVDVMRQARPFGSAADPFNAVIAVGADGWPTGDFGVTLMAAQAGVLGIPGTYKVIFNGQATVSTAAAGTVSNAVFTAATNTSTLDFTFPVGGETAALRFLGVPPGNPVKNLRVIRPGFSTTSPPIFTPTYLSHISRFSVLRFMDWLSTNDHANSIITWADRPTLEKKRTEAEGARWEAVIELANAVNRDIWINVPVKANDEYVTNLATQLRDSLNPSVNVYVEYSNELWNAAFPQFAIQKQLAIDEVNANAASVLRYDGSTDQNVWAFRRIAKRLKEISDIFRTVWGTAAINTRVRPVLAGQMANSFIVTEGINLIDTGFNVRPNSVFYAISGAPYIFPSANNLASDDEVPGLTAAQLLTAMGSGLSNAPNANSYQYESHLGLATWHNLKVLAYEGGFDTFGSQNIAAKRDANLDPQIRILCRNLINGWHAFGFESFVYFNAGADTYNIQFGQWPLLEDLQAPAFPKNQCMDDILGAAVPALTAGVSIATAVPGGAFAGSAAPAGTINNVSGPFGFPGFAQYLLRADTAGTYELRFTSTGSSTPKVGVQLNGATINSSFLLPQSATSTASSPITLTLRRGINALRLTRPVDASTWTIQSLGFARIATAQTVTFAPATPIAFGVAPITLTATASSGLTTFTFATSSVATICTVSGSQLTVVGAGTCVLTATQAGNANFASASANANIVITQGSQTTLPDLTVTAVSAASSAQSGAPVAGSATVKNLGTASAAATRLQFYASVDNVITTSDVNTGFGCNVPLLAGGASFDCTGTISVLSLTPGLYFLGAIADVDLAVAESNETNNALAASIPTQITGTPPVTNGVCGSANGSTTPTIPTNLLCNVGIPTPVTGTGPWNWTCTGSSGGTTASCAANQGPASSKSFPLIPLIVLLL